MDLQKMPPPSPHLGMHWALLLMVATSVGGCAHHFGPGVAIDGRVFRETLFASPPVVECRGSRCVLVWTKGEFPHFFVPEYHVVHGRLVFALRGLSSTGSQAGRRCELAIEGVENLEALRHGGAFWWQSEPEPEGTLVALKVVSKER